jgi:excisionase family DNA binding protein
LAIRANGPRHFTIDEAATHLRCSTKTLRRLVARGVLPERRVVGGKLLFVPHELDALLLQAGATSIIPNQSIPATVPSSDDDWINGTAGLSSQQKVG